MDPTQIPKPIVDLVSQTASKPISSFSEYISLKLFGKTNAKLKAEAENEYNKTRHEGEIARKVQEPFIVQIETAKAYRQYSNLGQTLLKASPLITVNENRLSDDNDVFWGLLEHSKEISNDEMQNLIAKIIAGEYNVPGTYSMSTLQVIKMLGKNELELFEKIGELLINDRQLPQVLFTGQENVKVLMQHIRIDFGQLQALQSLGLILPNDMRNTMTNPLKQKMLIQYFDKNLIFAPENENFIDVALPNFYGLSPVGAQIIKHLKPQYLEEYFSWLKENFRIPNYKLELL